MATIRNQTRLQIKGYLEGFIQGLVDEHKDRKILSPDSALEYLSRKSPKGELKPFQAALIPPELIDLYIQTDDGRELIFEIKSPKPNKGQCLEVLQRLLRFHLLRGNHSEEIQAYYAMPYNPYGSTKAEYRWSQALNYLPFEEVVVIGHDFWSMIGDGKTYEELLEIYLEVGHDKSKSMLDALAFGF